MYVGYTAAGGFRWVSESRGGDLFGYLSAAPASQGGHLVATTMFQGRTRFGSLDYTSDGSMDFYVAALNRDTGAPLWGHWGRSGDFNFAYGVVFTASSIFVYGSMGGPGDFGGVPVSTARSDAFVFYLNDLGDILNTFFFGGSGFDGFTSAEALGSHIYVSGYSNTGFDLAPGVSVANSGGVDAYTADLEFGGGAITPRWAVSHAGAGDESPVFVTATAAGIVTVGVFDDSIDVGAGTESTTGDQDIFVSAQSSSGAYLWSRTLGTTGRDELGNGVELATGSILLPVGLAARLMWDSASRTAGTHLLTLTP